jgi:HK97 family phage major capsid protein
MYAQNINRTRAEWYMSGDQYANIIQLATTGTYPLYQPNYAIAPLGTLFGRPINVIEQAGTATDESSLMFLDLSDYLVIGKGGVQEATSIHLKFLEDETAFRWTMRWGGSPLMASKITLPDGLTYSSFVTRD